MDKLTTVEQIAVTLFDLCSDKSLSATEIATKLAAMVDGSNLEATLAAVKQYRNTGVGLEDTAKIILNPVIVPQVKTATEELGELDLTDLNSIRDSMVTNFKWDAQDLTDDKVTIRETHSGMAGLWVRAQNKLYYTVNYNMAHELAVESLCEYICQNPYEVVMYGVTCINQLGCDELLSQAGYDMDIASVEGFEAMEYLVSEDYEED